MNPRSIARQAGLRAYSLLGIKEPEARRMAQWRHGTAPRVPLAEAFPGIETAGVTLRQPFMRTTDTSIDPFELLALCAIERHIKAAQVLEIGTFDGGTTLNLAANLADGGRVTTVDLPPDWDGTFQYDVPPELRNPTDERRVGEQFHGSEHESSIRQVFGDSATLDWDRLEGPFELVFIDGNHFYDYVKADSAHALAHLKPGGVVVWHDYGMFRDVSRAVDELAGSLDVKVLQGTRLAVARA